MIEMQITGDRELMAKVNGMPAKIHAALVSKLKLLSSKLRDHVVADKLDGQVLSVQSGRLSQSIFWEVDDQGNSVIGKVYVGGNIPYAAVHEYGGKSAYDIFPVKAQALAFVMGGKTVFSKHVVHPPAKERSYMRSSLKDMAEEIISGMKESVVGAVR